MKNNIYVTILLLLLVIPVYSRMSVGFGVYEITCEQKINPSGIDCASPRFGWKISSQYRGFRQSAYHVMVADSEESLASGKGNVWDSGKCFSSNSILVPFEGNVLQSATRYYWKVKVWNESGKESVWSKKGMFVTGIMHKKDWGRARWIALEANDAGKNLYPGIHAPLVQREIGDRKVGGYKLPMFRKELLLNKEIEEAVVNISGLGHFEFYINGEKVGNHFLDPGWTNYAKRALYLTFDVTELLKKENILGVMLGNGFYNVPRERYFKQLISFGVPKLKLCLTLKYKDGTSEQLVTDETWKVAESPVTYSSIYGGEDYDARRETKDWLQPAYNDSSWQVPVIIEPQMELKAQISAPLTVRDMLPVARKYKNSKGNWIFDFGQNFSGIVHLKVQGEGGRQVKMCPGELLSKDSTVNQRASGGPYFWNYTLSGEGSEEWRPRFTYYGFRYVEVQGVEKLESIDLIGLHTANSASEAGRFFCSLPMFNKIYELIDWSVRSNLASILTDCPHREKLGWLEVAHLMQYSMQYRYHLSGLYEKIMGDIKDSQTKDGVVPSIAPEYVRFANGFENSPEWGSAFIIIPWYIYKWYGDKRLLVEYYPYMKRYLEYLSTRADNFIVAYGLGDWFDLGPAHPGYSQLTSNGVTSTGMYYYNAKIMSQVAKLLNKEKDMNDFIRLASNIRKAYNEKYYDPVTRRYDRNSQTANAISLYFGLVEERNREAVYKNLIDDIKSRDYALTSGDIGYRYLLRVLEENGDSEIIYKMNIKYDVPGYGWQLAYGATALTESWQAYGFVSNNHCMLGHLMEWFFCGLGGIGQQDESVGFNKIKINPQMPVGINSASTSYTSPYGDICCHWKRGSNGIRVKVEIPANSEAVVCLPTDKACQVTEGGMPLEQSEGCKVLDEKCKGSVQVNLLSGHYVFSVDTK